MARRFVKVLEEEIVAINEAAFFYPSDLVNTIPFRVGEELHVSVYIHHYYSPPLRGMVVYYYVADPVLRKSPWFFLRQDFAVLSNSCIFVLEPSQGKFNICNQNINNIKKKKLCEYCHSSH